MLTVEEILDQPYIKPRTEVTADMISLMWCPEPPSELVGPCDNRIGGNTGINFNFETLAARRRQAKHRVSRMVERGEKAWLEAPHADAIQVGEALAYLYYSGIGGTDSPITGGAA